MTTFTFTLPKDLAASITSDAILPYTAKEELLFQAYIPGIRRITAVPDSAEIDILVAHKQSNKRSFSKRGNTLTIDDNWERIPDDVYHLLYSATRNELLKQKVYCAHAACVDINGLVLLAGHSGSGKTTLLLELLTQGHKVFSGNKTVVEFNDEMRAIAGTKTMTVKTKELRLLGTTRENIQYGERTAFSLPKNNYALPGKIKAIYVVRRNDGREEIRNIQPLSALHTLYPLFLDSINADTIVFGEQIYDGSVTEEVKNHLVVQLNASLEKVRTYSISGSLEFITKTVVQHET